MLICITGLGENQTQESSQIFRQWYSFISVTLVSSPNAISFPCDAQSPPNRLSPPISQFSSYLITAVTDISFLARPLPADCSFLAHCSNYRRISLFLYTSSVIGHRMNLMLRLCSPMEFNHALPHIPMCVHFLVGCYRVNNLPSSL